VSVGGVGLSLRRCVCLCVCESVCVSVYVSVSVRVSVWLCVAVSVCVYVFSGLSGQRGGCVGGSGRGRYTQHVSRAYWPSLSSRRRKIGQKFEHSFRALLDPPTRIPRKDFARCQAHALLPVLLYRKSPSMNPPDQPCTHRTASQCTATIAREVNEESECNE
jgi:hypothetical protein